MILSIFYQKKNGNIYNSVCANNKMDFSIFGELEDEFQTFLDVVYFETDIFQVLTSADNYKINLTTKQVEKKEYDNSLIDSLTLIV